jgi:2-oxoglutarate ferredoxin oxidoreductase subunit delta
MARGRIVVDENMCKGCGLCITVCPKEVIRIQMDRLSAKGYHPAGLMDSEGACTGCAICCVICPDAAITVYRWVPTTEKAAAAA